MEDKRLRREVEDMRSQNYSEAESTQTKEKLSLITKVTT